MIAILNLANRCIQTVCVGLVCVFGAHACSAAERPNIMVIMVDDMGFSDIGCYGSEIPTPHLDALAERGVKFSQFYNTGRCWPHLNNTPLRKYEHYNHEGGTASSLIAHCPAAVKPRTGPDGWITRPPI